MFRVILTSLLTAAAFSSVAADFAHPPGTSIKGHSGPQLTTEWWQWTMSIPDKINPVRDTSGANCGVGQNGPVWFLAGGLSSSKIRRTCSVPEGKTLFFPLVNAAYWNNNDQLTLTCDEAKAAAAMTNQTAIDLFAEIDGVAIDGLKKYRVASEKCFDVFGRMPPNQRPYSAYPSASDGYWLSLKPLPKGRHVLKFGGKYNRNADGYGRMVQDIEYELIVK